MGRAEPTLSSLQNPRHDKKVIGRDIGKQVATRHTFSCETSLPQRVLFQLRKRSSIVKVQEIGQHGALRLYKALSTDTPARLRH